MKKFDFSKWVKPELGAALMIVFGIILLFNPDLGSAAVATVLGWILVACGGFGLFVSVMNRAHGTGGGIVISIVLLVLGIYLLKNPLVLASLLGVLLGAFLLLQGVAGYKRASAGRSQGVLWVPGMVLSVIMFVAGLMLIFSPLATSRLVMTLAGVVLIGCGIANLAECRRERKRIQSKGNAERIIDAEE